MTVTELATPPTPTAQFRESLGVTLSTTHAASRVLPAPSGVRGGKGDAEVDFDILENWPPRLLHRL